jgi:endonuclease/exonuclease/phosphatase family metal-dependent hydrolase
MAGVRTGAIRRGSSRWIVVAFLAAAGACVHRPPMIVETGASACHGIVPRTTQSLTWIGPDDPRDRDRLARWCRAVGPAIADAEPTRAIAPPIDRLAVVTWNVHVGGGDIEALVGRLRRGELTDGQAAGQFALLLQEAYRAGPDVPTAVPPAAAAPRAIVEHLPDGSRSDIAEIARRLSLHVLYVPAMRNGRNRAEDRGTAILSTLPLTEAEAIELPFEHQRRVAVAATVSGTASSGAGWTLRLVDVQEDTALALTRGGPLAARRRQAEALLEAIDGPVPPGRPAPDRGGASMILGGDFNTWLGSREPAIRFLRRAFPGTPREAAGATWHGALGARAALDHVFVRGSVRVAATKRLASRFGSDHDPLLTIVEFELRGAAGGGEAAGRPGAGRPDRSRPLRDRRIVEWP